VHVRITEVDRRRACEGCSTHDVLRNMFIWIANATNQNTINAELLISCGGFMNIYRAKIDSSTKASPMLIG